MLRLRFWFAVLTVMMYASVAMAQRPGGGQGGPPRGGFGGGFGGGGFGGGAQSPLMLAGNEAVQKELGLKEDQVSKIKGLNDDARKEMQSAFGTGGFGGGGQDLSDEERQKRRTEMQEKMAAANKKVTETILPKLNEMLNDSQRERLQQIGWQAAGPQALQDAKLGEALKLTKEQKEKLAAINKEASDKQAELFGGGGAGGGDFQERFAKMREIGESRDKKAMETLTADQREQLEKLKGKPFDVAALRGGFGGGRGGPGGAGGPNPGGRPQRSAQGGEKKVEEKKPEEKK